MVGGAQYVPDRKPVPVPSASGLKPLTQIVPDVHKPILAQPMLVNQHSRTRTSSSSALPANSPSSFSSSPKYSTSPNPPPSAAMYPNHNRRTLSNATSSTTTTGGGQMPARTSSSTSASLRRSGSARSNLNPTSYVALMRKQKATVWCDRAQNEDPRLVTQRKNARMRAALEVQSGNPRTSTLSASGTMGSNVRAKIHRGKLPSTGYSPADLVGGVGGVPMRLSASEVGDEGYNEDNDSQNGHNRTGSGRSSMASNQRYTSMLLRPANATSPHPHRLSHGSTPGTNGGSPSDPSSDPSETPIPIKTDADYFGQPTRTGISTESGSSGDRENSFGNVGKLSPQSQYAHSALSREKSTKNPEELRRRGSIDERTSTMSGVRLYIANPDMSD
jgi:hypothetical protein